jgi:acetyltransferase-like isoleucine patch superfamily enzyme
MSALGSFIMACKLIRYLRNSRYFKFEETWRKLNAHNHTRVGKDFFPIECVEVGRKTYGVLNVRGFGTKNEHLKIGNYVSISDNVYFLLGGEHPYKTFSTYPFKKMCLNNEDEAITKGNIIIEDDVWIGFDCLFLSGVKVGQGAVIAAGSVVTKDVEPYSIVGGVPARFIKYRFDKEIRDKLMKIDFSKIDDDFIQNNKEYLQDEITTENVDEFLNRCPLKDSF